MKLEEKAYLGVVATFRRTIQTQSSERDDVVVLLSPVSILRLQFSDLGS